MKTSLLGFIDNIFWILKALWIIWKPCKFWDNCKKQKKQKKTNQDDPHANFVFKSWVFSVCVLLPDTWATYFFFLFIFCISHASFLCIKHFLIIFMCTCMWLCYFISSLFIFRIFNDSVLCIKHPLMPLSLPVSLYLHVCLFDGMCLWGG